MTAWLTVYATSVKAAYLVAFQHHDARPDADMYGSLDMHEQVKTIHVVLHRNMRKVLGYQQFSAMNSKLVSQTYDNNLDNRGTSYDGMLLVSEAFVHGRVYMTVPLTYKDSQVRICARHVHKIDE